MRWGCLLVIVALTAFAAPKVSALNVLFVGNSLTAGFNNYNQAAITDANGTGCGGVAAIFKKLADEGGFANINVTIEAVGGQTLAYHLANRAAVLSRAWDVVVLQEYSTRPLSIGDIPAFRAAVRDITALLRTYNPAVRVVLYETWARPDLVPGYYPTLQAMQNELQVAYSAAAADYAIEGWAPVGDAFLQAVSSGVASDPNFGVQAGKIDLWLTNDYHASANGAYLSGLVFYAKVLGGDPRALPSGTGSAVAGLGLSAASAVLLQAVAHNQVLAADTAILTQPTSCRALSGATARFAVTAIGSLAYQWRRDGVPLAGARGGTLELASVNPVDAGVYDVVVTGASGSMLNSAPAILTVTEHDVPTTFLFDIGSAIAGYPTPSPDAAGRYWNQLTSPGTGSRLSSVMDASGTEQSGVFAEVTAGFGGVNGAGVNNDGAYPAAAQRDSFFVTGTGPVSGPARGEIVFGGLPSGSLATVRIFASRAGAGARTGRYTLANLSPAFLNATDNLANTVTLGPVTIDISGRLPLAVEPFDAAGTQQDYAYLGVAELTLENPAPSAFELWTSAHGLGGDAAKAMADPDGDGQPNLIEFALGTRPDDASSRSMPSVSLMTVNGHEYISMLVARDAAAAVSLTVEVSSDLVNWFSGPGNTVVLDDTAELLHVRDASPVSAFATRFIRLSAALP